MKLGVTLKLLRIHTACLTMAGAIIGAAVAGERSPLFLFVMAVWALLFHAWGFLQNNLLDVEFDRKDPAKQHFPLVDGSISVKKAWLADHLLLSIVCILGVALIMLRANYGALLFLLTSVVFGTLYNLFSKETLWGPVLITVGFTSIPLLCAVIITETPILGIQFVALYTVFLMLYQISVEGYLKDIGSDRVNLLRTLGTKLKDGRLYTSARTWAYSYALTFVKIATLVVAAIVLKTPDLAIIFLILSWIAIWGLSVWLLESGPFNNAKRVRYMSLIEIFSYLGLVFALAGILGWPLTVVLVFFPILWFIVMNRLTWGTLVRPRV